MTWFLFFLIFLSICRLSDFSLSKLLFFWVYAGLVTFPYQNVWLFWVYAGLRDLRFTKPAYTQKKQHFDAKNAQSLHILKNIKSFDSEKSPNLHILKKIQKIKNLRLYVGLTGIDDLVFDFLDFFEYMQVWWLFTIKTFDFFEYMQVLRTFGIKMLFFWVYAGLVNLKSFKPTFLQPKSKNAE